MPYCAVFYEFHGFEILKSAPWLFSYDSRIAKILKAETSKQNTVE